MKIRSLAAVAAYLLVLLAVTGINAEDKKPEVPAKDAPVKDAPAKKDDKVLSLFNGKNLEGWEISNFGGEGEDTVEDGTLLVDFGADLSGVTWKNADVLPKTNYEITLDAKRVEGSDFFCGLTFPVKTDSCSLILGGWGGGVCGLSSIDGNDASENATTLYREFKSGQWYKIKLRVTDDRINAWIDEKEMIDADIKGKKISIRGEVEQSKPLGLATYRTRGAFRKISLRRLDEAEVKAAAAGSDKK